jgi:hypothetical protein
VGVWGWFPLAFEHSKVCTLCDFGHLQFLLLIFNPSNSYCALSMVQLLSTHFGETSA